MDTPVRKLSIFYYATKNQKIYVFYCFYKLKKRLIESTPTPIKKAQSQPPIKTKVNRRQRLPLGDFCVHLKGYIFVLPLEWGHLSACGRRVGQQKTVNRTYTGTYCATC